MRRRGIDLSGDRMMRRLVLVLLCWLVSAPAWAAVGAPPVQQTACNAASSSTPTCTYGSAVTSGNTLIMLVAIRNTQTVTSVSDSVNGAWTCPAGTDYSDGGTRATICYFNNTASGTPTVTLTLGGASPTYWNISEWSGVMDSSPEDVASEGADVSNPFTAGAGLTSTTAGLIVCVFSAGATITGATPATGFTALTNNALRDYFEYRVGGATTTDCSTSLTGPAGTAGAMQAFKEQATASVNFFPRRLQVNP